MTNFPPSLAPVQLTLLLPGTAARFYTTDLGAEDIALLAALGMTKACLLRICQAGDPWIVQVRETRIGLARSIARRILVTPETLT